MKMIKKIAPICLAAVMGTTYVVPALASPEFSRTEEEWAKLRDNVMEYDELEALIHEYNVTVLNNQDNLKSDRGKTRDELASDLRDRANSMYGSISYPDDETSPTYGYEYAAAAGMESQAKSLEKQADELEDDWEIKKLQFDKIEATLASGAQNSMNSYMQLLESRKVLEANYEVAKAAYDSTVAQASLNMVTQADVWNAQNKVQTLEANLISTDANIKKLKQNLCVSTGWAYDSNPVIMALPSADINRIANMNPSVDLEKAKENNYTLKIDKRKLQNAASTSTVSTWEKTIKNDEQQLGAALNNQYQAVLQAKTAYDQAQTDLALETKNMETVQRKYDLKMVSKLEYLQAQAAYVEKQVGSITADMKLLQAMDTYDWAVRGLLNLSAAQ